MAAMTDDQDLVLTLLTLVGRGKVRQALTGPNTGRWIINDNHSTRTSIWGDTSAHAFDALLNNGLIAMNGFQQATLTREGLRMLLTFRPLAATIVHQIQPGART